MASRSIELLLERGLVFEPELEVEERASPETLSFEREFDTWPVTEGGEAVALMYEKVSCVPDSRSISELRRPERERENSTRR